MRLFSLPIRMQLHLIAVVIALPAIAIIVFTGMQQRDQAVKEAYSLTKLVAERVASDQKDSASDIEQLLVTLAQLPDVRRHNAASVQPLLQEIKSLNPEFANILATDLTGKVWAAAHMPPPPSTLNDRRFFKSAVASGRFSSGEYVLSKSLGKPVLGFAYPYRNGSGTIEGVLVVSMNLDKYLDFLRKYPLPEGSNILLLDHNGIILSRAIEPEKVIGRKYPEKALQEMFAGPDEHSYRGVGSLNDERFISYRKISLEGESKPYMYVRVGAPVKGALASANHSMARNFSLFSAFLIVSLLLAYFIGRRSIADRIVQLQHASNLLAEGNLQIRVADEVTGGELGELAQSFDMMAGRLSERENAIKESEKRFKALCEASFGGVVIHDQGVILECNDGLSALTGFGYEELVGMNGLGLIAPESLDTVLTNIRNGYEKSYEVEGVRKDGSRYPLAIKGKNITYKGHLARVIEFRDISERKHAEEERNLLERQLLQAQKMESLGVLAGGIAHDFNNLLMVMIGNLDLAQMRIQKESPAISHIRDAAAAAVRAADLTKQMLAYSGKGKFIVEEIDLNSVLEEMLHLLQVSISKKVVLRLNPTANLPTVEADATQLRQIIMNMVINASEAIGDKSGVIAITTGCMDCDQGYLKNVWLEENLKDGLYVYLEIADTGCGIEQDILAKIFDPFFSTKFTGRGLGMAAVLGIIRGHKGAIKVYSEPGKGTTFKVLLPASGKPAEIFNGNSSHVDWHGSGKILLVDDEETVRGIGVQMLKELGFETLTANDGREAVDVFLATPDISLVILDLTMPHMDGEQCFRELRQIKPDVKVIMSSGYNEQEVTQKFVGKGLSGFIQKPYKLSVLREAIMNISD